MLSTKDYIILGILTVLCALLFLLLIYVLKKKNRKQIHNVFIALPTLMLIWLLPMIVQILCLDRFHLNIKYFYFIYYIGICFLPVAFFFLALVFERGKIGFKKKYCLLFIIPILSLILLWTNDFHHLFYKEYSTSLTTEYGWYFSVHTIYTFGLFIISLFMLVKYSIKNAGFFSKQATLIFLGALIPLIVNILGSTQIIPVSIYATPIAFAITVLCFTLGIFRFSFLGVAPIALQRIVDRISDSYVILDENGVITDFNKTLLDTFKVKEHDIRNRPIMQIISTLKIDLQQDKFKDAVNKAREKNQTFKFEKYFSNIERYFNTEITPIFSDDNMFLGTIILLKDITQHKIDIQTIESNQDMLMEQERLASLGQLIGGISHNLKTPIMSISGAAEGLNDLIKEYEASIGDPEVTIQDHHDIAKDMYSWTEKIKNYTEYMSDIITTVKGQAVTLSSDVDVNFTIDELIKRVDILMKHELKNALITLNKNIYIDSNTVINGDVNSLVQIINNLISNAIQSYNGAQNKEINLNIEKDNKNIIIAVQDFGSGMSQEVQSKLFKEMITTKGKNGSGLGLFMSYSTIKGHFKGNLTFESEQGKGTTFYIQIPV